jgi:hypothetical protein
MSRGKRRVEASLLTRGRKNLTSTWLHLRRQQERLIFIVYSIRGMECIGHITSQGSRNRPSVAQRVPGGLGSQISMTFGT